MPLISLEINYFLCIFCHFDHEIDGVPIVIMTIYFDC